jgi:hypothetical protein
MQREKWISGAADCCRVTRVAREEIKPGTRFHRAGQQPMTRTVAIASAGVSSRFSDAAEAMAPACRLMSPANRSDIAQRVDQMWSVADVITISSPPGKAEAARLNLGPDFVPMRSPKIWNVGPLLEA